MRTNPTRSIASWLFLIGGLLCLSIMMPGCTKTFDFIVGEVVQYKIEGIEDFEGILAQRTLVTPKDLNILSRVRFKKPHYFSSEVISPPEYAGYRTVFTGDSITVYWPWLMKAHRAIGLKPLTPEERQKMVDLVGSEITGSYGFTHLGRSDVAGRTTERFSINPGPDESRVYRGEVQIDREWSLPLQIIITDRQNCNLYEYNYRTITFNQGVPDDSFRVDYPEGTTVHTWDFGSPAQSLARAQASVDQTIISLPSQVPLGLIFEGIRVSDALPPLVISDYRKDIHRLNIIQTLRPPEAEKGRIIPLYLPVLTKQGFARYYPMAGLKFLSWEQGPNQFSLVSNLSLSQIIEVIDSIPR